mmetsp:Transcript_135551/g.433628  ORF Transcript_135551/g.433628 Transcript_135551/m.433628 type:complete len:254 (-) Transcript_135551:1092-1853(-)
MPIAEGLQVVHSLREWYSRGVSLQRRRPVAMIPLADFGGASTASDVWGWTDAATGRDYALVGLYEGTGFVDVTDPYHPEILGLMNTQTTATIWHDIKVYKGHAYVVSEAKNHGMQVFDLTRLRSGALGAGSLAAGTVRSRQAPRDGQASCLEAAGRKEGALKGDRFLAGGLGKMLSGGGLYMRPCEQDKKSQQWRYDSSTQQLHNAYRLCAELSASGSKVIMQACEAGSARQRAAALVARRRNGPAEGRRAVP